MSGLELLEKHPRSGEVIRAWFLKQMFESFNDEDVPTEFKDFMREQGVENDKVGKMIDINPRMLLDVFDENDIHISVTYGDHNYENNNLGELHYCATINNCETVIYCLRRKDAEISAIEAAFELLENKLTSSVKELKVEDEEIVEE
jgi:hypothetical protein